MKRSIVLLTLILAAATTAMPQGRGRPAIFAPEAQATGPVADFVKAMVTAVNNRDTAFFQKSIAQDAVWLDEDGHHLIASVWMTRLPGATPPRKLEMTNLRVTNLDANAAWAGFNYVLTGTAMVKGTGSLVLKKNGNDWQISLIHAAVDAPFQAH